MSNTLHPLPIDLITGESITLSKYKGKKLLIVNVASECGFTAQYEGLQHLADKHPDDLVILGVPCNDFGGQEPGSHDEIAEFCSARFGVTFPLTEKIGITKDTHPLYQWLTNKSQNGVADSEVKWNFSKYLIDRDGSLQASYPSSVTPQDNVITDWLNN